MIIIVSSTLSILIRGEVYKYQLANTPRRGVPRYSNCYVATWGLWLSAHVDVRRRRKREIYHAKRDLVSIHSETSRLYDVSAGGPIDEDRSSQLQLLFPGQNFTGETNTFILFNDRDLFNLGLPFGLPLILVVCESKKGNLIYDSPESSSEILF